VKRHLRFEEAGVSAAGAAPSSSWCDQRVPADRTGLDGSQRVGAGSLSSTGLGEGYWSWALG
jgi:hypothetical protein